MNLKRGNMRRKKKRTCSGIRHCNQFDKKVSHGALENFGAPCDFCARAQVSLLMTTFAGACCDCVIRPATERGWVGIEH
jgi:hypothetical protein